MHAALQDDPATAGEGRQATRGLGSLNPEQRGAACANVLPGGRAGPPLLIIAGAGSGKTTTLAHRVAHLVDSGADPQRILLLTFSRRAALDLQRRVSRVLQQAFGAGSSRPLLEWSGTFHSVGARILRDLAPRIGLAPAFTVQDRGDSEDLIGLVRSERGLASAERRFPAKATCLAIYSRTVNSETPLGDVLATAFPWCAPFENDLRELFAAYVDAKQAQAVLDFDDLLLAWAHVMEEEGLARELGERFEHVLVDEYQDTNRLQARILLALKPDGAGVTVVGDDAQAIYSFRAASVRNILAFPAAFATPADVVTLERNYRSTTAILEASNAVIGEARERFTKNLWTTRTSAHAPEIVTVADEAEQARFVAQSVLAAREEGVALRAQAVLFRSGSHAMQVELELTRRRIPFVKYGGLRFLETAHVKDVLALLRFAENPRGQIAAFRALQLASGVGQASARRILECVQDAADLASALRAFEASFTRSDAWREFVEMLAGLAQEKADWPASMHRAVRWYVPTLEHRYDDAEARRADLLQLEAIAATFPSRERFLTELTLDPPAAVSDEAGVPGKDDDYLILSTIHSAKGQEWRVVHVLNVVDGCIPSDMATGSSEEIEEERRLLYVAMTRARDRLALIVPQRFYVHQQAGMGDRHVYASRSRFVPDGLLRHFTPRAWPPAEVGAPAQRAAEPASRLDLAARLRSAWR